MQSPHSEDRREVNGLRLFSPSYYGCRAQCLQPPYFVLIDRSLRDEVTSYHYAPPSEFAEADPTLVQKAAMSLAESGLHSVVGASWTTDAPFRETAQAIEAARAKGILAVEMEAAALYAFARSAGVQVLCVAHVTNTMGQAGEDFEKGEADGTREALAALAPQQTTTVLSSHRWIRSSPCVILPTRDKTFGPVSQPSRLFRSRGRAFS